MGVIPRLRLYKIESGETLTYFDNKRLAKRTRDQIIEGGASNVVIMRGPDHWRGESFNVSEQMPKQGLKRRRR